MRQLMRYLLFHLKALIGSLRERDPHNAQVRAGMSSHPGHPTQVEGGLKVFGVLIDVYIDW